MCAVLTIIVSAILIFQMSVMCDKAGVESLGKLWVSFSIDVSIKIPSPICTGWNRNLFGYPYASSFATHGKFTILFNLKTGLNILAFGFKTVMFSVHAFFVYYENADLGYDVIRMRQLS